MGDYYGWCVVLLRAVFLSKTHFMKRPNPTASSNPPLTAPGVGAQTPLVALRSEAQNPPMALEAGPKTPQWL